MSLMQDARLTMNIKRLSLSSAWYTLAFLEGVLTAEDYV